jgi:hypothetical protein
MALCPLTLLYVCLLGYLHLKKAEKQRKYELERMKIELIITKWQIKEIERLQNNEKLQ